MNRQICKWFYSCPMKYYCEQGKLEKKWITLYCKGDWQTCTRFYMEENGEPHPDNMLPSGTIDKGLPI
ncbi:MAG: uracil-DNA glycosylase [Calditrichia bacterium]|nr:uracil-DNA glycosylase [Calditrichia bacterium]